MSVYDVWKAGECIRTGNVTEAMKYIANARKEDEHDYTITDAGPEAAD